MRNKKGITLVFTLCMLSMMSLLILSQYQSLAMQYRLFAFQDSAFVEQQSLLAVANQLMPAFSRSQHCSIPLSHSPVCQWNFRTNKYYFGFRIISTEACLQSKVGFATHIVLVRIEAEEGTYRLDVTFPFTSATQSVCKTRVRVIPEGIMSKIFTHRLNI